MSIAFYHLLTSKVLLCSMWKCICLVFIYACRPNSLKRLLINDKLKMKYIVVLRRSTVVYCCCVIINELCYRVLCFSSPNKSTDTVDLSSWRQNTVFSRRQPRTVVPVDRLGQWNSHTRSSSCHHWGYAEQESHVSLYSQQSV